MGHFSVGDQGLLLEIQKPNLYLYACGMCLCKQKEGAGPPANNYQKKRIAHKCSGRDMIGEN